MSQQETLAVLKLALASDQPVVIWGPPGSGKTSVINQAAKAMGIPVVTVIASLREPSDFAGLPVVLDGEVRMAPPSWGYELVRYVDENGKAILFLDEFSTAAPSVQAALLRVCFERVVGDLVLPKGVLIVAAGNPVGEAADGWELAAPLANRFVHLDWPIDEEAWSTGLLSNFGNDDGDVDDHESRARGLFSSYIMRNRSALCQVPKDDASKGRAWPSPRTWHSAQRLWAEHSRQGASLGSGAEAIMGAIGHGAAESFVVWFSNMDLPDPEDLIREPSRFQPNTRGDITYTVLNSVVAAIIGRMSKDRWYQGWKVLEIAAKAKAADIAMVPAMALAEAKPPGTQIPPELESFIPLVTMLKDKRWK